MDLVEKMSQITQVAWNLRKCEASLTSMQTSLFTGEIGNIHPKKTGGADWRATKDQGGNFAGLKYPFIPRFIIYSTWCRGTQKRQMAQKQKAMMKMEVEVTNKKQWSLTFV